LCVGIPKQISAFKSVKSKIIENNVETVSELLQRISLHFLGHTGQIIWIKKHLGKGGAFVMGVKKKQRDDSKTKWLKWWTENKEKYE